MRHLIWFAVAAIVVLAAVVWLDAPDPAPPPRSATADTALWVWRSAAVTDSRERTKFFRTARHFDVDRAWLALSRAERAALLRTDPAPLRAFIGACARHGIAVELLISENSWVDPERRDVFERALDDLIAYQRTAALDERFAALHLDVEPHALPSWKTGAQERLATGLVSLIGDAARAGLPVHVDVPTWYESIPLGTGDLLTAIVDAADGICVMNYRTDPDRFLRDAEREIALSQARAKSIVLGMSVEPTLDPQLAFQSAGALLAFRDAARATLQPRLGRARFAVQSYRHAKALIGLD